MPETNDTRVEEAKALIGTDALWRGQILYASVKLGVFRTLNSEPIPATDVATELGLNRDRTYRLLRALAYFGVLHEDTNRRFSITPLGEFFQRDHPQSVRSNLLYNRSPEGIRSMLHLPAIVEEGGPSGFVREFGIGFFEYTAKNPHFASQYNELMELASRDYPEQTMELLDGYDFSIFSSVCDIGGGRGHFLCHLLEEIPHLEGIVFDLPRVVAEEDCQWASKLGVTDRCRYVGGDMFDHVPEADAYFLKWILRNWDDDDCQRILSTIREAAPADGRLFVIETLVPGPGISHDVKKLDIVTMTQVGGRERTAEEFRQLLNRTGWKLGEVWAPKDGPINVLESVQT